MKSPIAPLRLDQMNIYSKSQMETGQSSSLKKSRKKFVPMRPIIEKQSTDSDCSQPKHAEAHITEEETIRLHEFKQLQNENKELRDTIELFSKDKDQIQKILNQWSQKLNELSIPKKLKEAPEKAVNVRSNLVDESSRNED